MHFSKIKFTFLSEEFAESFTRKQFDMTYAEGPLINENQRKKAFLLFLFFPIN